MKEQITSLLFSPNGHVSAWIEGHEDPVADASNKGWLQLYFEYLESLGYDPQKIGKIEAPMYGGWALIKPFKTTDGFWNYEIIRQ